ncbi:MAG: DNA-binding protein [Clostridiales bacterium]|nr:DNA-binding protein [Clostridiales bacterium]
MSQQDNTIDKLDEIVQLAILFDFYGELLNDRKKQIFGDYVLNDLSLGEISDLQGISRQGVYDVVKRCSQELKNYEDRLGLIKKFKIVKEKLMRIKEIVSLDEHTSDRSTHYEILTLADDILKEL